MKIASLAISALLIAPTYSALSYDTATQTSLDVLKLKEPKDGYKKARGFAFSRFSSGIKSPQKAVQSTINASQAIEFTLAEVANNQFAIIDNGNESGLPYFGTALHFNAGIISIKVQSSTEIR